MERKLPLSLSPLLLLFWLSGCADVGNDLLVELRTDLEPGVDFTSIRTVLDGGPMQERAVFVGNDFMSPTRIAEFGNLLPGEREVLVMLLDEEGAVVAERPTTFFQDEDFGLRVTITRDCVGVVCPGPTDDRSLGACHGGACVPTDCMRSGDGACPDAQCTTDTDCGADTASCSEVRCVEGLCMNGPDRECEPDPATIPASGWIGEEGATGFIIDPVELSGTCAAHIRLPLEWVEGMLTLGDGTLVVYGTYRDELTIGDTTHASSSARNAIVIALDPESGDPRWSVSMTGVNTVWPFGAVEVGSHLYVTGYFSGAMTVGTTEVVSETENGFLVRLDTESGTPRGVFSFGGSATVRGTSLSAQDGSLYLGGWFDGTANLFGATYTSRMKDAFVVRLSATTLSRLSSWTYGGRNDDTVEALDVDGDRLFAGGYFRDELVFGDDILFSSELDAYVGAFDLGGASYWGGSIAQRGMDFVRGVDSDGDYVAVGGSSASILADGMSFTRVHRRDGTFLWEQSFGDRSMDNQGGNVVIREGVVYMAGVVTLPLDVRGTTITGTALRDLLVTAQDAETGELLWHRVVGSEDEVVLPRIALGHGRDLWVSSISYGELHCAEMVTSPTDGDVALVRLLR